MLLSYNPSNCELTYLYSVLRSKSQSAIHHGTLFMFETPIQAHRRFLRKFFTVDKFRPLSFTQLSCEWKSILYSKKEPLDVFKRKIVVQNFSCIALARVVFLCVSKEEQND